MSITLDCVSKKFGEKTLFSNLTMEIPSGSRVCFFGESGKGKTTLLRIICGLDKEYTGKVTMEQGITFAVDFQEDRLLPWYTVSENLNVAGCTDGELLLREAGIADAAEKYPDELSGGMRRRASLVRALGFPSDVLVLDEPIRELDKVAAENMLNMIEKHIGTRTLLLVTHDISNAQRLLCKIVNI